MNFITFLHVDGIESLFCGTDEKWTCYSFYCFWWHDVSESDLCPPRSFTALWNPKLISVLCEVTFFVPQKNRWISINNLRLFLSHTKHTVWEKRTVRFVLNQAVCTANCCAGNDSNICSDAGPKLSATKVLFVAPDYADVLFRSKETGCWLCEIWGLDGRVMIMVFWDVTFVGGGLVPTIRRNLPHVFLTTATEVAGFSAFLTTGSRPQLSAACLHWSSMRNVRGAIMFFLLTVPAL